MSAKIDIAELKRSVDIVEVIGRFLHLKPEAPHMVCPCPFHKEKTSSFKVTQSKQMFKCFGCGKGGDVIDFIEAFQGISKAEAIKYLHDPNNTAAVGHGQTEKRDSVKKESTEEKWMPVIPAVKMAGMFKHWKYGEPSASWEYLNEQSELIGYACRFDLPDGKQVLPLIYGHKGTVTKWVYSGFPTPRPLYGLHKLIANPTATVFVVEGEKTANAGQKLFPNTVVVTWMGGAQGVRHADWSVLKDRNVIVWPDNDTPGFDAMHVVHSLLKDIVADFKWMLNPSKAEKGWDVADAEWDIKEAKQYSSTNLIDYPGKKYLYENQNAEAGLTWTINAVEKEPTPAEKKKAEKAAIAAEKKAAKKGADIIPPAEGNPDNLDLMGSAFFRMLGAQKDGDGMKFYFYTYGTKTVIGLSPSAMTKNNLMQLAPLDWWKNSFPDHNNNKNAFSVDRAANYLIRYSSTVGTFTDKWLRGRGAWMDGSHVVVHAGDKLFIDGKETKLSEYKSRYIYEIGEELGFTVANPVSNTRAVKLIELLNLLNWDRSINSFLLAGWCIVAPVCGALNWRPHIWLTGAAGTGKSWIFKKLVRELLGETGLAVQGETSEAGLRQTLLHDALPVVFDEAEGEDRRAQDRMQSVLSLMRASSANDGGLMAKGSAGGSAKTYRIRSCFAFASIGVQVAQQSDRTRVSILGLMKATDPNAGKRWLEFQEKYDALITEDFCKGIRSRTVKLLPVILKNIKTFSNAAAAVIGEQRAGDQIGVLLAGAYSLYSDKEIDYKNAVKWVNDKDWTEEKGMGSTRDEVALQSFLLEQMVRVETKHATVERSVGELVLICMLLRLEEWSINVEQANDRLKRMGMKVKDGYLYISNSDVNIQKMLVGTAWSKNHHKILMRIDGAIAEASERFASGVITRAVKIHKDVLFPGYVAETIPQPMTPIEAASEISKPVVTVYDQGTQEDLPF